MPRVLSKAELNQYILGNSRFPCDYPNRSRGFDKWPFLSAGKRGKARERWDMAKDAEWIMDTHLAILYDFHFLKKKALTAEGIWNTSVLKKYSTCLANKCLVFSTRIVVPSSVKTGVTRHFSTLLIQIVGGSSDPVCECKLCAINPLEHVTWGEVLRNKNKTKQKRIRH